MTSWPQNAYVGQKVVCVQFGPCCCGCNSKELIVNSIYVIASIREAYGEIGFELIGIKTPKNHLGFSYKWFRPAQSTDTGMAILKELLINPHKVLEDA